MFQNHAFPLTSLAPAPELAPDNGPQRLLDIFFYGLYQDPEILAQHGVSPRRVRRATLHDYALRLGKRGSLLRERGARTPGLVMALTPQEIDSLYAGAGLSDYCAEAVWLHCEDGSILPALCYITRQPAAAHERNPDYAQRLARTMRAWQLPTDHIH